MRVDELNSLEYVWHPAESAFADSPVGRFAHIHHLDDLANLCARADSDPAWFWGAVVDDLGIQWSQPYRSVLELPDGPQWPRFFAGGRLNITVTALDRWVSEGRGDHAALWWQAEGGQPAELSYRELLTQVQKAAGGLKRRGLQRGDVVAVFLPMCPEAVVSILAIARIGAIAMPLFSGYGPGALHERLLDGRARALITADVVSRRGKVIELSEIAHEGMAGTTVEELVVVKRDKERSLPASSVSWEELCDGRPMSEVEECEADDPFLLLYTSGSTGAPKGCIHSHAGLPIKVAQEARFGLGVDDRSRVLWLTDMGWVMGPWLALASLINGATAILFEGTPDWPEPDELWRVAAASRATVIGLAPTVVRALMKHGSDYPRRVELPELQVIGSTGEPWNMAPWMWCFEHVGRKRIPIVNICGGTECGGSILSGSLVAPLKPCSFSGPALGMAADVVAPSGRSVRGEVGELVVRFPWPGMTRGFWGASGERRYLASYWNQWPGIWHHGDFAYVDRHGVWYILGRSDDTIKVAGKRLGPAEIESLLTEDEEVLEAAAVGIPHEVKGEVLVCFVVPAAQSPAMSDVDGRLASSIQEHFGKALMPQSVHRVTELPKTRNGKIMRRMIRQAYQGLDVGDTSALDNPDSLHQYRELARGASKPGHKEAISTEKAKA